MNNIKKTIWFILLVIPMIVLAQSNKDKDWGALAQDNPENAYLQFQAGLKTFFSLEDNDFALQYFQKASQKVSTSEFNITESKGYSPVEVYYYISETFRRMELPDSSMKYLLKYQKESTNSFYDINLALSKSYNSSLVYRQKIEEKGNDFVFNKKYHHPNNPIISLNGEKLFFTTEKERNTDIIGHINRDIIYCTKTPNGWSNDTLFLFNTTADEYPVYCSPLGDDLYFVRKDKKNRYHLYKSQFRQGKWSEPEYMPKPFNSAFSVKGFSMNVNQDKILITKEVEGHSYLYYGSKEDDKWTISKKINISPSGDVLSPLFHFSDTLIYFTSNGINYNGLGGFDIYSANLSKEGNISNIKSLPYPINRSYNIEYFTLSGNGISFNNAYHNTLGGKLVEIKSFSDFKMNTEQLQSLKSLQDIVVNTEIAEVLEVEKEVIKEVEKEVIQEVIEIEEVEVDKEVSLGYVTEKEAKKLDNIVRVETDTIVEYLDAEPEMLEVDISENSNVNDSLRIVKNSLENIKLDELDDQTRNDFIEKVNSYVLLQKSKLLEEQLKKEEVKTTSIKIEGPNVEAENIYFDLNVVKFSNEDQKRLNKLAEVILSNKKITVEIVGYTDSQGNFKANRKIALARADNIYSFLIKKGIPKERMISYGRAFLQQASTNKTEVGRKLNRRVEILLYH